VGVDKADDHHRDDADRRLHPRMRRVVMRV
jgi:hypothetical protein